MREVYKLHVWLELKGDLDFVPSARQAEELTGRRRGKRVETDDDKVAKAVRDTESKKMTERFAFVGKVRSEADKMIAECGIPQSKRGRHRQTVPIFLSIAQRTRPDSAERREQVVAFLAQLKPYNLDETLLLRIADLTFTRHAESEA